MRMTRLFVIGTALVGFGSVAGCDSGTSHSPQATGTAAHHDHDHAGHAHNHGQIGPHGGRLIELGSEAYHAELVHDYEAQRVTVYLLGAEAQHCRAARVDDALINLVLHGEPAQYRLDAFPQGDETAECCSRFVATDARLIHWLGHEDGLQGRLNFVIAGQQLIGDIEHAPHAAEAAHDHDHHDDPHHSVAQPVTRR